MKELSCQWATRIVDRQILVSVFNQSTHFQDFISRVKILDNENDVVMQSGSEQIIVRNH